MLFFPQLKLLWMKRLWLLNVGLEICFFNHLCLELKMMTLQGILIAFDIKRRYKAYQFLPMKSALFGSIASQ